MQNYFRDVERNDNDDNDENENHNESLEELVTNSDDEEEEHGVLKLGSKHS